MRRCDPRLVALDADRDAVVHGDGERLRAAHAAEPGGQRDRAGQRAAEPLVGDRGERLEGALQDALGADVDPRAGGHLAVHRQPEVLEPAELLPVGPVADQVGVGDQHPRRPLVGAHHADRLAGLHEQRLVVLERRAGCARGRRTTPSCARPCRCRRRRRGPRGARRSRGRGCSSASAAAPRSATSGAVSSVPWAAWMGRRGLVVGGHCEFSDHCLRRRARTAPERTSATAVSISGERWRSGPGPSMPAARSRPTTAPVAGDGSSGARRSSARAAVSTSIGDHPGQPVDRRGAACGRPTSPSRRGPPASRWTGSSRRCAGHGEPLQLGDDRGLGVLRDHVPAVDARVVGEERRQPVAAGLVEEPVGTPLADRRDVGGDDREEVEHVGDRGAVEVAVATRPGPRRQHHRVVDRAEPARGRRPCAACSTVSRAAPCTCGEQRSE